MQRAVINGKEYAIYSRQIEEKPFPLIPWLSCQSVFPKVYWKERDSNREYAAFGKLLSFDSIPHFGTKEPVSFRFYGASAFSKESSFDDEQSPWKAVPSTLFFLPEVEVVQDEEMCTISQFSLSPFFPSFPLIDNSSASKRPILSRSDIPSFETWRDLIEESLKSFQKKEMDKVVLARKTTLEFQDLLDPWGLLSTLQKNARRATIFAIQPHSHAAFLGASPEMLYRRIGEEIYSDALAGTRPRGKTKEEDESFKQELLFSDKEKREFGFVKTFLQETLLPLCSDLENGNEEVLQTSTVQHLYCRFKGKIRAGVTDQDLIDVLHPTPAIGGKPRIAALNYLKTKEPFERGWYSAPIGWINPQEAHFAVGIRSALVQEKKLHLFAGTGIVPGSDALKEWEELELKISPFIRTYL